MSDKYRRVYFEPEAVDYPLGQSLYQEFSRRANVEVRYTTSHNRVTGLPSKPPNRAFVEAKRTLVVGVKRSLDFATCRPSAHYQLPLGTGCPGFCRYCYLHTTLGKRPYVRVYVNRDAILVRAQEYIKERAPETTVFEGAATSDPVAIEPLTGSLALAIEFFAKQPLGRFRFTTKYDHIEGFLHLEHGGHTRIRFSINTPRHIENFEKGSLSLPQRLTACRRVGEAGYPVGLMIAPIFLEDQWQQEYKGLIEKVSQECGQLPDLTIELITHRFTKRARGNIETIFPEHGLPMDDETRQFKYGQFGYGKYVYPKASLREAEEQFSHWLREFLPNSRIDYLV